MIYNSNEATMSTTTCTDSGDQFKCRLGELVTLRSSIRSVVSATVALFAILVPTHTHAHTLEVPFALSSDHGSEFGARFAVFSPGEIIVEATWNSPTLQPGAAKSAALSLILFRPDGREAASRTGSSALRIDYPLSSSECETFIRPRNFRWKVKLINDADRGRTDVVGLIRISVPSSTTTLANAPFTLLGNGNAREVAFIAPAPGRVLIEVSWRPEHLSEPSVDVPLTASLIHPSQSRTYARRQGTSPIRVEHQITERELDLGLRWVVRVENNSQVKVNGTLKVSFTAAQ
jgi:hypothetical protein